RLFEGAERSSGCRSDPLLRRVGAMSRAVTPPRLFEGRSDLRAVAPTRLAKGRSDGRRELLDEDVDGGAQLGAAGEDGVHHVRLEARDELGVERLLVVDGDVGLLREVVVEARGPLART